MNATDYWLSKLFFDLQRPDAAAEYRADQERVLDRYPLAPEVRAALLRDDVEALVGRVNAYLLRYYFGVRGMPDDVFVRRLHALADG